MSKFSRRSFLIAGLLGSAAALLVEGAPVPAQPVIAAETASRAPSLAHGFFPHRPDLLVAGRGVQYGEVLRRVVAALGSGGMARPGEVVVIKPTLAYNRQPGQGGNVHPDVLQASIELALEGGARQVIVFDRTALPAANAYRVSGALQAVRNVADSRVRLVTLTDADFVPLDVNELKQAWQPDSALPTGYEEPALERLMRYRICKYVLEADRIVNLASARTHPTRGVALGMANLLGLIGGGPADAAWNRHQDAELAVLTAAIRPDLTILDATRPVVRNGPMGRGLPDLAHWNLLVAGRDPLAVETYGASLFGVQLADLPAVGLAAKLAAGNPGLTRARVLEL